MKTFIIKKLPILLGCFVTALILSPACKAQSEISPDHFEDRNTEPFAKPANLAIRDASSSSQKPVAVRAQVRPSGAGQAKQLVAVRNSNPAQPNAVALQDKRKTVARKSEQPHN